MKLLVTGIKIKTIKNLKNKKLMKTFFITLKKD